MSWYSSVMMHKKKRNNLCNPNVYNKFSLYFFISTQIWKNEMNIFISSGNIMKRKWPRCQNRISFWKHFLCEMHLLPILSSLSTFLPVKYSNISFIFYLIICNVMYAIKERQHLVFMAFPLHGNIILYMLTFI